MAKGIAIILMVLFLSLGGVSSYLSLNFCWALSSVPFAAFLIMLGSKMKRWESLVTSHSLYSVVVLGVVTGMISHFFRLDMAWNSITPLIPIVAAALAGTLMVFIFSAWLECKSSWISCILQRVGQETYVVMAFSSIIIMLINAHLSLNPFTKYVVLVVILTMLICIKNGLNRLTGKNII